MQVYSESPPPNRRHVFRDAKYACQAFPVRWYAYPRRRMQVYYIINPGGAQVEQSLEKSGNF